MIRKNIYRWHRTLSLVIAVPVLLWAASGFMHPVMTTFRPAIATHAYEQPEIDSAAIRIPVEDVLSEHAITRLHTFRIVEIGGNWFYQVQKEPDGIPDYYSTRTGRRLNSGDELYAQYLANHFLNGYKNEDGAASHASTRNMAQDDIDCCLAAARYVRRYDGTAKINGTRRITAFSNEYKYVNRLLPVYRISFDRNDGIRVYVETTTGRLAHAIDKRRAFFDSIFSTFHTWNWLDALGKFKYFVMIALLAACLLTSIVGIYIFIITKGRSAKGNGIKKARKNHRWTAVSISLFTIMFAFSGAFHAFEKIRETPSAASYVYPLLETKQIDFNFPRIDSLLDNPITDIRLACVSDKYYWRITTAGEPPSPGRPRQETDPMKKRSAPMAEISYFDISDQTILAEGERRYARCLASHFSGRSMTDTTTIMPVTKFEGEYGFVNKRLPVWKVAYQGNGNERYYIETLTGALATRVEDRDLFEGYSFALLHKHHFMDWGGKTVRDISTMFWAMAQIVMVGIGLTLWRKVRRNGKQMPPRTGI